MQLAIDSRWVTLRRVRRGLRLAIAAGVLSGAAYVAVILLQTSFGKHAFVPSMARVAAPTTLEALAALLDPPSADAAAVRAFVIDLSHKISSYRDAALSREEILRVAEDPSTPPKPRVTAAMVYSKLTGPEGAPKIRIAAERVGNEPVRLAIEKVADGEADDDVIERAMRA